MQASPMVYQTIQTLPTELWREIFRLATYVSGLLDIEWEYDSPSWIPAKNYLQNTNLELPSFTKQSIVQVCRMWRYCGMEFFSEHIDLQWIQNSGIIEEKQLQRLPQLVSLFKTSSSWSRGRGWFTKAIIIDRHFIKKQFTDVLSLLEECHNLAIFHMDSCRLAAGQDVELAQLMERRFTHSLRKLDYSYVTSDGYRPMIPNISLRFLSIQPVYSFQLPRLPLESISTLEIDPYYVTELSWQCTSLRHLRFTSTPPSERQQSGLISFVERHSGTLVSLSLHKNSHVYWIWPVLARLQTLAALQISHDSEVMTMFQPASLEPLPCITDLTVDMNWRNGDLCGVLDCAAQGVLFPNLRVVKVLYLSNQVTQGAVEEAAVGCLQKGIRVESDFGEVMPR